MVPKCFLFDCLSLIVNPIKMSQRSWASRILRSHLRVIYSDWGYDTSGIRPALRALAPVIAWFGKILKAVAALRAIKLK